MSSTAPSRVWVVDDDDIDAMQASRALRKHRSDTIVEVFTSAELALAEARGGRLPDAILVDRNMPRMSGLEFTAKLRALPRGATPKLVVLTGVVNDDIRHDALQAGADAIAEKPLQRDWVATLWAPH